MSTLSVRCSIVPLPSGRACTAASVTRFGAGESTRPAGRNQGGAPHASGALAMMSASDAHREDRRTEKQMSFASGGVVLVLVVYLVLVAVIGFLVYLVLRFAIRDGLRGHRLWLERTHRAVHSGLRDE